MSDEKEVTQAERNHIYKEFMKIHNCLRIVYNTLASGDWREIKDEKYYGKLIEILTEAGDIHKALAEFIFEIKSTEVPFNIYQDAETGAISQHRLNWNDFNTINEILIARFTGMIRSEHFKDVDIEIEESKKKLFVWLNKEEEFNELKQRVDGCIKNAEAFGKTERSQGLLNEWIPEADKITQDVLDLERKCFGENGDMISAWRDLIGAYYNKMRIVITPIEDDYKRCMTYLRYNMALTETFAKIVKKGFEPVKISLNEFIQEVLGDRLKYEHHPKHEIIINIKNYEILFDKNTLYWILMRALSNAEHAVENVKRPKIKIWTKNAKDFVDLIVEDNGMGIKAMSTRKKGGGKSRPNIEFLCEHQNAELHYEEKSSGGTLTILKVPKYVKGSKPVGEMFTTQIKGFASA